MMGRRRRFVGLPYYGDLKEASLSIRVQAAVAAAAEAEQVAAAAAQAAAAAGVGAEAMAEAERAAAAAEAARAEVRVAEARVEEARAAAAQAVAAARGRDGNQAAQAAALVGRAMDPLVPVVAPVAEASTMLSLLDNFRNLFTKVDVILLLSGIVAIGAILLKRSFEDPSNTRSYF